MIVPKVLARSADKKSTWTGVGSHACERKALGYRLTQPRGDGCDIQAQQFKALAKSRVTTMGSAESHEIICTVDLTNVLRWVSPSCKMILGWTPQEMVGKRPELFFVSEDLIALPIAPQTPNLGSRSIRFNARVRRNDGSHKWMSVLAGVVRSTGADAAIEIVLIMQAIVGRKIVKTGVFRPGTFEDIA